jgi:hypothetical protein
MKRMETVHSALNLAKKAADFRLTREKRKKAPM